LFARFKTVIGSLRQENSCGVIVIVMASAITIDEFLSQTDFPLDAILIQQDRVCKCSGKTIWDISRLQPGFQTLFQQIRKIIVEKEKC
jgi:hypothetical protein